MLVKSTDDKSELPKNAKAQISILNYLRAMDNFVAIQSLNDLASNPTDVCKKLSEKNLVVIKRELIIPDLTGFSFKPMHKKIRFTDYQNSAVDKISTSMDKNEFRPFLLHGVTGSGKTEIYIEAARHAMNQEKTVIMLPVSYTHLTLPTTPNV